MKQSAAKTLGVAAVGAAFAAAGAGAANAAPAAPDAGQVLGTVTHTLPAQSAVGAGGLATTQPAAQQFLSGGPAEPVQGLIGGLPVGQALPGQGLGLNGLPLG